MKRAPLPALLLAAALPGAAFAQDAAPQGVWTGTGEAGFAMTRGNTKSENLNARLAFGMEDASWKHDWYLTALRAKAETDQFIVGTNPDTGAPEVLPAGTRYELTANRYEAGASSAYKFDDRNYIVGALRYENDDFSPYAWQGVFSVGYGHVFVKNDTTYFAAEVGPGFRRARDAVTRRAENNAVGRGKLDFSHKLTANTTLYDTFLIESGKDNTFMQNDIGVQVAMNEKFALKAGYQIRRNSEVLPGIKKNDSLTTLNLVYNFNQ